MSFANAIRGLFGSQPLTQGIAGNQGVPNAPAPQQAPQVPQGVAQRKGLFGGQFNDTLGALGAAFKDVGNAGESNHLGAFQKQQQLFAEQQRQQQALTAATQGLTPQQQALAQINPQAFSQRQISNQFQDPLAVQAQKRADDLAQNTIGNTQFQQGRLTQNDALAQQQQALDNQFRQQGRDIQQDQFGQNLAFKQDRAGVQDAQFGQQFGLQQQKFGEQQNQNDITNQFSALKLQAGAQPKPPTISEQIALEKFEAEKQAKAAVEQEADDARKTLLSDLGRLREGGDLAGGINNAFGIRVPFGDKIAGSDTAAVRATVDKITANLTLDKIKNFKGAISDKDLEIAQNAATILQRKGISNSEAKKEIDRLFNALSGAQQSAPQGAPQQGQVQDGYVFLGGDPSNPSSWRKQ